MKKSEKILLNIANNRDIQKKMSSLKYYSNENFLKDSLAYIKAIKEGRMIVNIVSVSNSGMSRVMNFKSCEKSRAGSFYYRNWNCFFIALGFSEVKNGFRISGCGMDMVFHTNYTIIHVLFRLGFISRETCDILAQNTPSCC